MALPRPSEPQPLQGLNILAFCDYYGASSRGGTDLVAAEVYRRMVEWGAQVTVVSASFAPRGEVELDGVRVIEHPTRDLSWMLGAQVSVAPGLSARALDVARQVQPQVLHANTLFFQTSLAAARLQRRLRLPLVTTVHIAGTAQLDLGVRLATGAYERTLGQFVLRRSSAVIAVSEAVESHLRTLGVRVPTTVVPNGVDHEIFHPASPGSRAAGPPVVALVGRLIANKGPGVAVEAVRRLLAEGVALRAVIVGEGPLRGRLEAQVSAAGLSDAITFTGQVDDVARHLRAADVLVRPSSTEGMPLAVLEAMACEVCVVASDVPGNTELVEHGRTGLVFPVGDVDGFVQQLRRVLLDAELRHDLAAAARRAALTHSWDRCAQDTAQLLQEAARPVAV